MPELFTQKAWFNFVTSDYDWRSERPDTDEECTQYISQYPIAMNLYSAYREAGFTPFQSMANTLSASVGEPPVMEEP